MSDTVYYFYTFEIVIADTIIKGSGTWTTVKEIPPPEVYEDIISNLSTMYVLNKSKLMLTVFHKL